MEKDRDDGEDERKFVLTWCASNFHEAAPQVRNSKFRKSWQGSCDGKLQRERPRRASQWECGSPDTDGDSCLLWSSADSKDSEWRGRKLQQSRHLFMESSGWGNANGVYKPQKPATPRMESDSAVAGAATVCSLSHTESSDSKRDSTFHRSMYYQGNFILQDCS